MEEKIELNNKLNRIETEKTIETKTKLLQEDITTKIEKNSKTTNECLDKSTLMFVNMQHSQIKSDKNLDILIGHLGINTSTEQSVVINSIDISFEDTNNSIMRDTEHTLLFTQDTFHDNQQSATVPVQQVY
jgi:hypothetical protein